jgi:hypothetical protein
MRRTLLLVLLFLPFSLRAQTAAISNHCYLGGTQAKTSGLSSTNFQLGIVPSCTVTVYLAGTLTKPTIFSDASGTALSNPFTANTPGSVDPGGWIFWAAVNQGYDVVLSGGISPNTYAQPVTLSDVFAAGLGAGFLPLTGGTLTGPLTAPVVNGTYGISNFGIKCDGSTNDSAGLNSIGTFAASLPAGNTATIQFPSNAVCVHASSITTWAVSNLHILGNGSRLKFTGAGKQIYLHGSGNEADNLEISGFVLQGNSNSTDGVYQDNGVIARSTVDLVNVQDQSHSCYYLSNWELSTKLNLPCSANLATVMGVSQVTQPQYGVIAGDPAGFGSGFFANNRNVNVTIEGTGVIGLWCKHCTNQNNFYGTSEGTTSSGGTVGVGVQDYTTTPDGESQGNTLVLDTESNAVADMNIGGLSENLVSQASLGPVNITGGWGSIVGGTYQSIAFMSGHANWNVVGATYNSLQTSGAVTGYNSGDCLLGVVNRQGGTATNACLTGYLLLTGGTISGNLLLDGITSTNSAFTSGAANGDIVLQDANYLRSAISTHNLNLRLIGLTTGNVVSIDPDGQGTVFGAEVKIGANSVPVTQSPTGGQAACIKAVGPPVVIGTCSTVVSSSGACTCN